MWEEVTGMQVICDGGWTEAVGAERGSEGSRELHISGKWLITLRVMDPFANLMKPKTSSPGIKCTKFSLGTQGYLHLSFFLPCRCSLASYFPSLSFAFPLCVVRRPCPCGGSSLEERMQGSESVRDLSLRALRTQTLGTMLLPCIFYWMSAKKKCTKYISYLMNNSSDRVVWRIIACCLASHLFITFSRVNYFRFQIQAIWLRNLVYSHHIPPKVIILNMLPCLSLLLTATHTEAGMTEISPTSWDVYFCGGRMEFPGCQVVRW